MGVNERSDTQYVVLWHSAGSDMGLEWTYVADVNATSAKEAVKLTIDGSSKSPKQGVWVAVPARSWKPMRVEQVQTVQTVITAADDDTKASNSKNAPESEIRAVEAEAEES